jgi:exopolysaccharide biosynthesis polyprenyl glycosylphosphotransferase
VRALDIERVIVAFPGVENEETLAIVRELREFDIRIDVVPQLYELIPPGADVHTLEGLTVIGLPRPRLAKSSKLLKRSMDVVISAIGLLVLSPLFLLTAIAIKLDSRGPVFFRQVRMGMGEQKFRIFKFRTMTVDADQRKGEYAHMNKHARNGGDPRMFKIPGDPRVTRVGRFLRRYSLDELPQLVNVLLGQMSLVGPRPLILEEDSHVQEWARERLRLKPGITGLWQVLGRDSIGFEEMVRLDYLYVTTWSLWNDLRLMLRTLPVVAHGERIPY